eukprot:m.435245 g.435245  ORF g.435245 m.435245 type:complete len:1011 (+) comp17828_c0_seq1:84-3116(+)
MVMARPPSPPPLFPRTVTFETASLAREGLGFALEVASKLGHLPLTGTAPSYGPLASRFVQPTGLVVVRTQKGSPAAAAGLLIGDRIALVNGQSLDGLPPTQAAQLVTKRSTAEVVVLHDPQLATALIQCDANGIDPLPESVAAQTVYEDPSSTRAEDRSASPRAADVTPAVSVATASPAAATQTPPPTQSSPQLMAPFAWNAQGLTRDQAEFAMARRREELLNLDLSTDTALQGEWQSLIAARNTLLMRDYRSIRHAAPPRNTLPSPLPKATPNGHAADGTATIETEDEFENYSDKLVSENETLKTRVKELWAVIGLFKADRLAEKLIELQQKLDAARVAVSAEGVADLRADLADAQARVHELEETVAEQDESLESAVEHNERLRAKLAQRTERALEKFANMQRELDSKDAEIARLQKAVADARTKVSASVAVVAESLESTVEKSAETVRVLPADAPHPPSVSSPDQNGRQNSDEHSVRPKPALPAWLAEPTQNTAATRNEKAPIERTLDGSGGGTAEFTKPAPIRAKPPPALLKAKPPVDVSRKPQVPSTKPIAPTKPTVPSGKPAVTTSTQATKPTSTLVQPKPQHAQSSTGSAAALGAFRMAAARASSNSGAETDDDEWNSDGKENDELANTAPTNKPKSSTATVTPSSPPSAAAKLFRAAANRKADSDEDNDDDDDWGSDTDTPSASTSVTTTMAAPQTDTVTSTKIEPAKPSAASAFMRAAASRAESQTDDDDDDDWGDKEETTPTVKNTAVPEPTQHTATAAVSKPPSAPSTGLADASPPSKKIAIPPKPTKPTPAPPAPKAGLVDAPSSASKSSDEFEFPPEFLAKMADLEKAELDTALEEWLEMFPDADPSTSEDWAEERGVVLDEFQKFVLAPAKEEFRKEHQRPANAKANRAPPESPSVLAVQPANAAGARGSSSEVSELEERINHEIGLLVDCFHRIGTVGTSGRTCAKFGQIFSDEIMEQELESLVGTLRAAKKRKVLDFPGAILLQGTHDDVEIVLL